VPVGTGDEVERLIREARPEADFAVVSNPEFLREGAIADFKRPGRIVIGTQDERAAQVMRELTRPLYLNHSPILQTSRRTAELTKYAANAFLATKITFINEIADLCEQVGADVQQVARGIGLDNRIGGKFLHAGPGYGGSCIPKDTLALIKTAQDHAAPCASLRRPPRDDQRKRAMARRVIQACGGEIRGKRIAVLGLTFKPNTDDMRDAPSLALIAGLRDFGAKISAYDPEGTRTREMLDGVDYAEDPYACAKGADALVIVTEWDAFRALDFERIKKQMAALVLVDLRNIFDPTEISRHGFTYVTVGRPRAARLPGKCKVACREEASGT
jgi:UDPglucose 6-dehydrogenase